MFVSIIIHRITPIIPYSTVYKWATQSQRPKVVNYLNENLYNASDIGIPFPALDMTVRESPTFATYRWFPTRTAVEAVEPSSRKVSFSDSKKSVSVC